MVNAIENKPSTGKALSTPAVRAFAKEKNVDISLVKGTGRNGRVTREDVVSFMKAGSPVQEAVSAPSSTPSPGSGYVGIPSQPPLTGVTEEDQVKKITGIKKAMTKTMTQALSIPTFTFSDDIDATDLMRLRKELK